MTVAKPSTGAVFQGVSIALSREGKLLLVQRGRGGYRGLWSLPGGHIEPGEDAADAAARELTEETGIVAAIGRRIDTVEILPSPETGIGKHYVLAVFEAEFLSGSVVAGDDAEDAGWFGTGELAALKLTPETRRMVEVHRLPSGRAA
jgi:8-oxo-dGTP pyrophosphatase MutT (NUDIX family)